MVCYSIISQQSSEAHRCDQRITARAIKLDPDRIMFARLGKSVGHGASSGIPRITSYQIEGIQYNQIFPRF